MSKGKESEHDLTCDIFNEIFQAQIFKLVKYLSHESPKSLKYFKLATYFMKYLKLTKYFMKYFFSCDNSPRNKRDRGKRRICD